MHHESFLKSDSLSKKKKLQKAACHKTSCKKKGLVIFINTVEPTTYLRIPYTKNRKISAVRTLY
jgi:hypothetical protein